MGKIAKRISIIIMAVAILVGALPYGVVSDEFESYANGPSIKASEVVDYMNSLVDTKNNYVKLCLLFVSDCWVDMGFAGSYGWVNAANFAYYNTVSTSRDNIPIGADVFFTSPDGNGHIGVYVGDGNFVHAGSKDLIEKSNLSEAYYAERYTGWGWHPNVNVLPVPVSAEFVPANGFVPEGFIGQKAFLDGNLFGKGNKIVITLSDGSTRDFVCDEAGYTNSDQDDCFFINVSYAKLKNGLRRGKNQVTYTVELYDDEDTEYDPISLTVDTVAKKYDAYVVDKYYLYTGKNITVKPVVMNSVGKKVPESAYTYSYKKHRKMGEGYTIQVKFKNTALYPKKIIGWYTIGPKKPEIKKIKPGARMATVYLKSMSKKHLKNINKYAIVYDTDKEWLESKEFDYDDLVFVDKNKTSIKFRKLKKGKTYYFRICSWSKSGVVSPWSKIMKVRIN